MGIRCRINDKKGKVKLFGSMVLEKEKSTQYDAQMHISMASLQLTR